MGANLGGSLATATGSKAVKEGIAEDIKAMLPELAAAEQRRPTKVCTVENVQDALKDDAIPHLLHHCAQTLFTANQIRSFRTLDLEPGIKLLGFKDRSELQFEDNIKHAYFLYPDEAVSHPSHNSSAVSD
jgi:hypothetical protein